jgi:hypothetical protein
MTSGNQKRIVPGALMAVRSDLRSTRAAADGGDLVERNSIYAGLSGPMLSDEEMSDIRARYARGSWVDIQVNGVEYTHSNPTTPGSSSVTVNLGRNTVSRGFASTSGTGGAGSRVSISLSNVTFRTSGH